MLILAILEDEKTYCEIIETTIQRLFPGYFEIHSFADTKLLIKSKITPDILVSDIELENENAITFAETLSKNSPQTQVIFVSAYHNYAQDIFKANPVYYIQKPITDSVFQTAIEKALHNMDNNKNNFLTIKINSETINIPLDKILYLESENRIIICHTKTKNYQFYGKLNSIEKTLTNSFLRVHQSFLVNMKEIKKMNSSSVHLISGEDIPISQNKQKDAKYKYTMFLANSL